jgi:pimeloyl-ACP methyl ester carboxylesterase
LFISIWAIITDSVVEHGKAEEEERLTGRAETRKSLREWCSIFFGSGLFAVFLVASVLMMCNLSILARDATLEAPGQRIWIDNGGYNLHLYCSPTIGNPLPRANGSMPTVLIETGSAPALGRMESWVKQTQYRYCYYDRPGFGFSDAAPSPLSAGMAVDALSEALTKSNETGPWVVAAHAVGGIYGRIFAARHVAEVRGLLLVDTLPESLLGRIGNPGRGFALWLRGVISPLGLQQLWGAVILRRGREDRVYGREAGCGGKALKARLQEALAVRWTANEVEAANGILGGRMKTVVVSSGDRMKRDSQWAEGQRALAGLGKGGWDVVDGVGSEVWRSEEGVKVLRERLGELM